MTPEMEAYNKISTFLEKYKDKKIVEIPQQELIDLFKTEIKDLGILMAAGMYSVLGLNMERNYDAANSMAAFFLYFYEVIRRWENENNN